MPYIKGKTINISNDLSEIHDAMISRMKTKNDEAQAKVIETYLQSLKYFANNLNNANFSQDSGGYLSQEIVNDYQNIINSVVKTLNFKSGTTLFKHKHSFTRRLGDDIVEDELAAIIAATINETDYSNLIVGDDKGLIVNAELYKQPKQILNKYSKALKTSLTRNLDKVSIKTDVQVAENADGYNLNISANSMFDIGALQAALNGATFTVKNYATERYNNVTEKVQYKQLEDIDLKLGAADSGLYKAIMGGLAEIPVDGNRSASLYYTGINHLTGRVKKNQTGTEKNVRTHFSHLRFTFELRGAGFIVNGALQPPAKFLVYNNPSGPEIYVRSTASIVNEILNKDPLDLLGKKIKYSAAKVKSN